MLYYIKQHICKLFIAGGYEAKAEAQSSQSRIKFFQHFLCHGINRNGGGKKTHLFLRIWISHSY